MRLSPKQLISMMEKSKIEQAEQSKRNDEDRVVILSRLKWAGYTNSIPVVAETLGVLSVLESRVAAAILGRQEAIDKCIAAKQHWQPKKLDPKLKKPRCNRCGARVDVTPVNDTGITYREWCEMLEGYHKDVEPGRLPTGGELQDAGYYQPDHAVPSKIKPPHSLIWHPIINLSRHDIIGLSAAVRLARQSGALPSHGNGPEILATSRNESGRRWSF